MGPRGLVASYLHRDLTSPTCQADQRVAGPWTAQQESRLRERRGGRDRMRAEGAGPNRELPFADRVIATLVILRFQLPHAAVALFYEVDCSTITRAVHEVRPLLAARGFAVPGNSGLRLRTLADVFPYAAAERAPRFASTAPRCRSGGPGPVAQGGGRSFPGRRSKTRSSPQRSATARGGCCGSARSAWAACTTSPRCAPRASRTCCAATPGSAPRSTPDTRAWPAIFPSRLAPRPRSPGLMLRQTRPPAGNSAARPSPPSASASSMPSPNQAVEIPAALPRTPGILRRHRAGHRRTGI
jgi:hypothetical protein